MESSLVIMNFSGTYQEEKFYKKEQFTWLDLKEISGTNGYLEEEAKQTLEKRMDALSPSGVHFIDSGNYHYVSKLWTDKIQRPFILIVFDHHSDMQPSLFENLLSCGCWIKEVVEKNPYVQKVILIGISKEQAARIPKEYEERIICVEEHERISLECLTRLMEVTKKIPIYISIDKDVLQKNEVATNWDQGSLSLQELIMILQYLMSRWEVIGVDICGEYAATVNWIRELGEVHRNDEVNEKLLNFLIEKDNNIKFTGID